MSGIKRSRILKNVFGVSIEDIPDELRTEWLYDNLPCNGGNCFSVRKGTKFGDWLQSKGFRFYKGLGTTYVWDWVVVWR